MKQMLKQIGMITAVVLLLAGPARAGDLTLNGNLTVTTNANVTGSLHVGSFNADGTPKLITFGDIGYVSIGENTADDQMELTAGNFAFINGNVGIGTNAPARLLHVSDANYVVARFDSSSTIGTWLALDNSSLGGQYWQFISTGSANGGGAGNLLIGSGASDGVTATRMTILTNGFVGVGTLTPATKLDVAGEVTMTVCNITSDRNAKELFTPVNARDMLDKVVRLPISEWQYKEQADARHIGPMAQDFHEAFAVGRDDTHITSVDADGVALAAIQGLNEKLEEKDAELSRLKAENQSLAERLAAIERALGLRSASMLAK